MPDITTSYMTVYDHAGNPIPVDAIFKNQVRDDIISPDYAFSSQKQIETFQPMEGKWELIEKTVTKEEIPFVRTQEPDGTAYSFSSVYVKIKTSKPIQLFFNNGNNDYVTRLYLPYTSKNVYGGCKAYVENGFWSGVAYLPKSEESASSEVAGNNYRDTLTRSVENFGNKICELKTFTPVASGSEIEIWAVRA